MKFADRVLRLGTEGAFEVLAKCKLLEKQGKDIIHLEIGQPDFPVPINIKEAAINAIKGENEWFPGLHDGYTPSAGYVEVRQAIADYTNKRYGLNLTFENVVVMPGAKPIIFQTLLSLVNKDEEVVYPDTGYPAYASLINCVSATHKPYLIKEENDFRFDHDEFASQVSEKTKVIIINTPHNPTGGTLTREDLEFILKIAEKYDCSILADEIYSRMVYDGQHETFLKLPGALDRCIVLDGHSKTYCMTGWRLGYAISNVETARMLTKLMTNSNSCTSAIIQVAGVEALLGDQSETEANIARFKQRREVIINRLNAIPGVTCRMPKGAFYAFPNVKSFGKSSKWLEEAILAETGVACLAGTSFGAAGEGYLRFSYANSTENLNRAMDKLEVFFANLH